MANSTSSPHRAKRASAAGEWTGTEAVAEQRRSKRRTSDQAAGDTAARLQQAEMLLDISRKVAAIETLDEVLATLVDIMTEQVGAERGTLFLNDEQTGELYSRVAQGNFMREIRLLNTTGVAGNVFQTGEGAVIDDAYADERFNRSVDEQTGFVTKSILCAPVTTVKGEVIGAAQALNKKKGKFTGEDLFLLGAMTQQASIAL